MEMFLLLNKITFFFITAIYSRFCILCASSLTENFDANLREDINKYMENFSSDDLLSRVKGISFTIVDPYKDSAWGILIKRKDKRLVPVLINELTSWNRLTRVTAIRALGTIGDESAAEPLMAIVNRAKIDYLHNDIVDAEEYLEALEALAKMKYEPAYQYALELVLLKNDPKNFRSSGIIMLGYFEKPESISLLKKIYDEHPEGFIRDNVKSAIQRIESAQ